MAVYNSEEDMPFDVENANTFPDQFTSAGGQEVDSAGFPIDSAGIMVPNEQVFQVDNSGFPIPMTPVASATSTSNQVTDRNMFSTPTRIKQSEKVPATPDTISSRQDEQETGARGFPNNFDKGSEGTNNSTSHSDSSQADDQETRKKRCQAFKTRTAIIAAVLMLLVLITIMVVAVLFLSGEDVDKIVPVSSPTASTPLETTGPAASPSLDPNPSPTLPPASPPTGSIPAPVGSLDVQIREFLFENSDVSVDSTKPVVRSAFEWLVDEANQTGSLVFPLDPKYLQRFGILILYFSVNPNGQATFNGDSLRLPSPMMINQDECAWRGMECDENGMVTDIKLGNLGLDGTLPSEWAGFFPNLKSIDVSSNKLVGFIPEGVYDVLGLEELYLYKNQFGGTISSKIGNLWELKRFVAGNNRLSGPIPPELASTPNRVRKLRTFNVHRNQMTGTIPANMRLRQLYYMDLGSNYFSGDLPVDTLGTQAVRLRHLYLDHNNFMGTFPAEVLNAGDGRLKNLAINDNQFVGAFPDNHNKSNSIMVELTIQNNFFDSMGGNICYLDALTGGEMVEFNSDCTICQCRDTFLCRLCWMY